MTIEDAYSLARDSFSDIVARPAPTARSPARREIYGKVGSSNEIEEEEKKGEERKVSKMKTTAKEETNKKNLARSLTVNSNWQ